MLLSKPFQILNLKYETDFLDISFIQIDSKKLSADLLVLTTKEKFRV